MMFLSQKTNRRIRLFLPLIPLVFSVCCSFDSGSIRTDADYFPTASDAINLNSADAHELQRLPGIGPKTAEKIVAHRREFGAFRRPSEIILVDGFGEKQYLKIRHLIKIK